MNNSIFYFCAKTQYENVGDKIINRELLSVLRLHGEILAFDGGMPADFISDLNVTEQEYRKGGSFSIIKNVFLEKILKRNRNKFYYILNPGGFHGGMRLKNIVLSIFQIIIYALFSMMNVKICRVGYSIDSFSFIKQLVERAKSVFMWKLGLRDQGSFDYARKMHFSNICLFPDFAFMLPLQQGVADRNGIIVSVRMNANSRQSILDDVRSAVERVSQKQQNITLACQVNFDLEHLDFIANSLSADFEVKKIARPLDEVQASRLYKNATYVFSNRLHVLLLALSCGAIPIAVIDQKKNAKIFGIFEDNGMKEFIYDQKNTRVLPDAISETFVASMFAHNASQIKYEVSKL